MNRRISIWAALSVFLFLGKAEAWGTCTGPTGGGEGECAPDFVLRSAVDNKEIRLSSFAGKVVFLNFWASWCEPCREEIPSMIKAQDKLKDRDLVMLAVSIDSEGKKEIEKFFKKNWPPFQLLMDPEHRASHSFGTFKVPETYIIDRTGRIRDKVEGIRDWTDSITVHYLEVLTQS